MGAEATTPRRLNAMLLLGICTLPIVFVWFLFRRGYSWPLRRSGLAWLAFNIAPGIVTAIASGTS